MTYAAWQAQGIAFAAWLQAQGVRKGDRVALMMPNCLQYPICLLGTILAGAVVVNVNPLYTSHELKHLLKDSGAETVVIFENFAHTLKKSWPAAPSNVWSLPLSATCSAPSRARR